MMNLEDAIGQTYKHEESGYTLSDLTLEEWAKYASWLRYKPYREALAANLPQDVLDKKLEGCDNSLPLEFSSKNFLDSISKAYVAYKLVELSISIKHPNITIQKLKEKISDKKEIRRLQLKVLQIAFGDAYSEDNEEVENP